MVAAAPWCFPARHNLRNAIVFSHLSSADRSQGDQTPRRGGCLEASGSRCGGHPIARSALPAAFPGPAHRHVARRTGRRAAVAAGGAALPANLQAYDGAALAMSRAPTEMCCSSTGAPPSFTPQRTAQPPLGRRAPRPGALAASADGHHPVDGQPLRAFELLHASAEAVDRGRIALVAAVAAASRLWPRVPAPGRDAVRRRHRRARRPAARPSRTRAAGHEPPGRAGPSAVGATVVAEFGDERWVSIDRGPVAPTPLAAVVLVSRVAARRRGASPRTRRA